jgi:phosphoglycerate dehydrogenase-like enzyme
MGLGDIGRELARVGKAFDMQVMGLVSSKERYQHMLHSGAVDELFETHSSSAGGNHLAPKRDIDVFLSRCDYVVNALPSTAQTKGLLGLREFSACKPGAVFINIGRGDILNEGPHQDEAKEGDVVLEAVDRGYLAGAVLDVFRSEPLAPPSRLWSTHPEVLVTPHVAAISYGRDVARLFKENLLRYVDGRELLFPVDWHKGY